VEEDIAVRRRDLHLGLVYKKIGVKVDRAASGVDIHVEPVY